MSFPTLRQIGNPWRFAAALLAVLLVVLMPLLLRSSDTVARAAASASLPEPGQLTVLDKDGQPGALCPLQHTDVQADVAGPVAHVTVTQQFSNPSKTPIEALYTFPLPADAAVDDMTMTIGDRIVQGEIKRKEEARAIYEAAKAQGQSAALLDQERPNIFTQNVANILPGEQVKITIKYVNLLKYENGVYEWSYPMVVGPRYTPGGGYTVPGKRGDPSPVTQIDGDPGTTSVVTDADKITPPITPPGTRAGHDISLQVRLDAGTPIGSIQSVLHPIEIQRDGSTRAVIALKNQNTIPNKDFILRYQVAGAQMQEGLLAYASGGGQVASAGPNLVGHTGGYFTFILQPPVTPPSARITPKEMVFVIDQTGSQAGWPIHKAKEVMSYLIQNMNPGDMFQLLGFDTDVHPCFAHPVNNTPENVARAQQFLDPIEGEGGTDILKSVDYALSIPKDPNRQRIICYLTDGYVGNDMQILDYVQKHRGQAHMFPFGMGNSVNRLLIDGMAKDGGGEPEYVTLNSSAQEAAARFYRRISQPLLTNISVDWGGLAVSDVYPKQIPDMFLAGRPVILKGRYISPGVGDVTVHGTEDGQPWSRTVHIVLPSETPATDEALPTLWAREKIEDLQEQDWMGAQTGNPDLAIKEQIVQTALQYRLMSQWTSFVAVEQRVVNVGGHQRTIDVPVEMPDGVSYQGIFGGEQEPSPAGRPVFAAGALAARSYSGGFAGGGYATQAFNGAVAAKSAMSPTASVMAPRQVPKPLSVHQQTVSDAIAADTSVAEERDIALGTTVGQQALRQLTPTERQARLEQVKLPASLRGLAATLAKEGVNGSLNKPGLPVVTAGRVEVQIRLNTLPPDGLAQLKALGFDLSATLTPGRLLLGTADVAKLDKLIELTWVRRVEPPQYQ